MKYLFYFFSCICLAGCAGTAKFRLPKTAITGQRMTGTAFYEIAAAWQWKQRDSLAVAQVKAGNIPAFLRAFVAVSSSMVDSLGKEHKAIFYVSPDYISLGTNEDWARVPLTPMAAQEIADHFNCFLPTRKIVDLVYQAAVVKLSPVPMYAFRDSSVTMWQHNLIIEGQRKSRKGLIAGIKKDLVISGKISRDPKPNREAIYGWHRVDGRPIQPLYTGHINWWVDYSHGARLVYRIIQVDGIAMDYTDVLKHPFYHRLICDEDWCDYFKYPY